MPGRRVFEHQHLGAAKEKRFERATNAPAPAASISGKATAPTRDEADVAQGWQFAKVGQPDIEKETQLNSQMNDMQLNSSRYRAALNAMGNLTAADRANMQAIINTPEIKNILSGVVDVSSFVTGGATLSQLIAGKRRARGTICLPTSRNRYRLLENEGHRLTSAKRRGGNYPPEDAQWKKGCASPNPKGRPPMPSQTRRFLRRFSDAAKAILARVDPKTGKSEAERLGRSGRG